MLNMMKSCRGNIYIVVIQTQFNLAVGSCDLIVVQFLSAVVYFFHLSISTTFLFKLAVDALV